jgi:iron complex outermembrane receptor protein
MIKHCKNSHIGILQKAEIHRVKKYIIYATVLLSSLCAIELPPVMVESSKLNTTALESTHTIDIVDANKTNALNINSIEDLSSVVPNTNISGIGTRSDRTFTFRGISNYLTYESSVAMYIDDAPVPFSYGYGAVDMKNIKTIEVLKGPQGTLFGKSAESGVINIYTKPTSKEFKSEVRIGAADYNTREFYVRVSGPTANEDLTYALSITKESRDGFSKDEFTGESIDDKDFLGFSAKLRYKPGPGLDIALNYTKSIIDDGGTAFKTNTKDNPYVIDNHINDDYVKMDNDILTLVVKHTQENYKITSATSYAKEAISKEMYFPVSGGIVLDHDIDIEEITQEFRLNYDFDSVDFLAGAFYSDKTKFDYTENIRLTALNASSLNSVQNPDKNLALFTQAKYYIDNHYSILTGIRYQQTKRSFSRSLNNFFSPTTGAESSTTWTHVLPTLSLSYSADDASNIYLTYSKGYRPGGYNYRATGNTLTPFEPESTDSLELGHKRAFGRSTTLNSAVFYNRIKDLRINILDDNLVSSLISAQKAYSYGVELQADYKADDLTMYAAFGIIKTQMLQIADSPQDEGNNVIDTPNITASLGARYSMYKNYYAQADIKHMGTRYYNISNSAKESAYRLVNIGFGYEKDGWQALVYANNLFNREYVDFMIYTPSNNYYHFGNPRVLGFKLSKNF